MPDRTAIEWTDATWNPLRGCTRVSAGCQHCYAEKVAARFSGPGQPYEGLIHPRTRGWNGQIKMLPHLLRQPLSWKKPRRIFVNSMSDLFHGSVPAEFIDAVFAVMAQAPHHTFQVLTKRPDRMLAYLSEPWRLENIYAQWCGTSGSPPEAEDWPLPNVWLGVSVENQATADERIPLLLQCPAAVRWLSCEPLLGRVDLCEHLGMWWNQTMGCFEGTGQQINARRFMGQKRVGWLVAGGESGHGARPMHPDWARSLRDQCAAAGVPFFFKQWGEWEVASAANGWTGSLMPATGERLTWLGSDGRTANPSGLNLPNAYAMARGGKRKTGRLLDGIEHNAYPEPSP